MTEMSCLDWLAWSYGQKGLDWSIYRQPNLFRTSLARTGHALLGALRLMCNCTRCAPNAVADRRIPESLSSTLAGFAIRRRREKSLLGAIMVTTGAKEPSHTLPAEDRVAVGRCRPTAPTDPYVLALEHTVPRIMGSLRVSTSNGQCEREPAGSAGACDKIYPRASSECDCGD